MAKRIIGEGDGAAIQIGGQPRRYASKVPLEGKVAHVLTPTRGAIAYETALFREHCPVFFRSLCFRYTTRSIESRLPVDEARDVLVKRVLKAMEAEPNLEHWVLWVDDDMAPYGNCVLPLFNEMQRDKDIDVISALCSRKVPLDYGVCSALGTGAQLLPNVDYEPGQIVEVNYVGLAFTLHRASILKEISEPRFEWTPENGEDAYFSALLRRAGKKLFVHTGVTVGHVDTSTGEVFWPNPGATKAKPRPWWSDKLIFTDNFQL